MRESLRLEKEKRKYIWWQGRVDPFDEIEKRDERGEEGNYIIITFNRKRNPFVLCKKIAEKKNFVARL